MNALYLNGNNTHGITSREGGNIVPREYFVWQHDRDACPCGMLVGCIHCTLVEAIWTTFHVGFVAMKETSRVYLKISTL